MWGFADARLHVIEKGHQLPIIDRLGQEAYLGVERAGRAGGLEHRRNRATKFTIHLRRALLRKSVTPMTCRTIFAVT